MSSEGFKSGPEQSKRVESEGSSGSIQRTLNWLRYAASTASRVIFGSTKEPEGLKGKSSRPDSDEIEMRNDTLMPVTTLFELEQIVEKLIGPQQMIAQAILQEVRARGGPAEIGVETYVPGEIVIQQGEPLPGNLIRISAGGTVDIYAELDGGIRKEIGHVNGYAIFGEISALGHAPFPTVSVAAGEDGVRMFTVKGKLLRDLYAKNSHVQHSLDTMMRSRIEIQQAQSAPTHGNILASLALLSQSTGKVDRKIVNEIRREIEKQDSNDFLATYEKCRAGTTIFAQGEVPNHIDVILRGSCTILQHGVPVAVVREGATLGDVALSSPDLSMPFSIESNREGCELLRIPLASFLACQEELAGEIEGKASQTFEPVVIDDEFASVKRPKELDAASLPVEENHYRARHTSLMMSGLERVGDADEILYFLSKLGQLQMQNRNVSIKTQEESIYTVVPIGSASPEVDCKRDELIEWNLERVFQDQYAKEEQIGLFEQYNFDARQAAFLLASGYVLSETCDIDDGDRHAARVAELRERLPSIMNTSFYLDAALKQNHPELAGGLKQLLFDFEYPLTVTKLLANEQTRPAVIQVICKIAQDKNPTDSEFQRQVEHTLKTIDPSFLEASRSFTGKMRTPTASAESTLQEADSLSVTRQAMMDSDQLYRAVQCIDDRPTDEQKRKLDEYTHISKTIVQPALHAQLENVAVEIGVQDGFPFVFTRTKKSNGVIDKITRMRNGYAGKEERPDYVLGDMPDITGGRIVTKDIKQLIFAMDVLEESFGGGILHKDNFYVNEEKRTNPYRVITYTVQIEGQLCEIQLATLQTSISADISHNITYKPIAACSLNLEEELSMFARKAALADLDELINHNVKEVREKLEPFQLERSISRDFFRSLDYGKTKSHFLRTIGSRVAAGTLQQTDSDEIVRMLEFAEFAHETQTYAIQTTDKTTGTLKYPTSHLLRHVPYVNHSVRVATMCAEAGLSADSIIAALFHDTKEDRPDQWKKSVHEHCPPLARNYVDQLSEKEGESREAYMTRVTQLKNEPKWIKALDRLDNLLRGHTMLNPRYLRRTLQECAETYDRAFDSPPLLVFKRLYLAYRKSIEQLANKLEGNTGA